MRKVLARSGLVASAVLLSVVVILVVNALESAPAPIKGVAPPAQVDGDALARKLSNLITFPTITYPSRQPASEAFALLHAYLAEAFPAVHSQLEREVIAGHSLLFRWPGTDPSLKPILLLAHQDVVPVEPDTESQWEYPPFGGVIAEGYVWGRGAVDDKAGVMTLMQSFEDLLASNFQPKRSIYLALGHDEEIPNGIGAKTIAKNFADQGIDFAFVLDEGMVIAEGVMPGLTRPVALIGVAEKGYVTVELVATGPAGHSSVPPRNTAVAVLSKAIVALEENPFPASVNGPVAYMLDAVTPHLPFGQRLVLANRWLFAPALVSELSRAAATNAALRTTSVATIINAGVKDNVVPTQARALVNLRIRPGETVASAVERVRRVIADSRVQVSIADDQHPIEPSPVSPVDSSAFEVLRDTVNAVVPEAVVAPSLVLGATDSRYFTGVSRHVYRFRPVLWTPQDGNRVHGVNERIAISDLTRMVSFYTELIRRASEAW